MRKVIVLTAAAALLLGCSPSQDSNAPSAHAPAVAACNSVAPDRERQVAVGDAAAEAAAASDLRGGAIAPGVYDLTRAARIGAATGWIGTRAVALEVSEAETGGVTFNWAGVGPDSVLDTWTATFTDTPQPKLTYTCGRIGEIAADFAAHANALQLRLPDGANGQLALDFQRRP
jgi:hypothetical protein